MAHHTYGVQEPIMEKLQTHVGYEKLCEKLNSGNVEFEHKPIGTQLNATTTIAAGGKMLMRAWVEKNSYVIRHAETGRYLQVVNAPEGEGPRFHTKSKLKMGDDVFKTACILNINTNESDCIYLNNSTSILRGPDPDSSGDVTPGFPTPAFYQASYSKYKFSVKKLAGNKVTIHPTNKPEYCMINPKAHPNLHKKDPEAAKNIETLVQFSKKPEHQGFEWELIPVNKYNNSVVAGVINRPGNFNQYANDETYAIGFLEDLPDNRCPREWIWMVKDYVWEMVPSHNKENTYKIKLVADDRPDMYLFYVEGQDKLITGGGGDEFEFVDKAPKYLKHLKTGKYVNVTGDGQVVLQPSFAELAMCPQQ